MHFCFAKENMSIFIKYNSQKSKQILIPNQLAIDVNFTFLSRNLLIIILFTSNIAGFKSAVFLFFFSHNKLFN